MTDASHQPGTTHPEVVVLDVNETLSDLAPLSAAFAQEGLPREAVEAWFAGVLRDAFALTVLGECPAFAEIGRASLIVRADVAGVGDPEGAAERIMGAFTRLSPHPDVVPGLIALAEAGCRIVTLSNGSAEVARALLGDTAAGPLVEQWLSVADAGAWKPHPGAYRHALRATGVAAEGAMLVAVHPWDIAGAAAAGLRTAWIGRDGGAYPEHMRPADVVATSLVDLAERL